MTLTRVTTLLGPKVTDLYEETVNRLDELREQRRLINLEIKDCVAEELELRKYMRLFDPGKIRPPQKGADEDDEQ